MRAQWISAVILGAALAAGCGDKGQQNAQNSDQPTAAPAGDATGADGQAVSPDADNSALQPDTSASQSAGATRSTTTRPAPSPRSSATAPRQTASGLRETAPAREPAAPVRVVREVTVPAGTSLPLELMTAVSSETATVETPVRARLREAVEVDGRTAFPAGTVLTGTVTDVERAGRVQGRSRLAFRFDSATINGVRENLRTNPVTFEGEATKAEDAKKIGIGAGVGAAIGAIAGGGSGAAKGAAIGGAAGTGAVLATRGKEVVLAEGTNITATTASALTVEAR